MYRSCFVWLRRCGWRADGFCSTVPSVLHRSCSCNPAKARRQALARYTPPDDCMSVVVNCIPDTVHRHHIVARHGYGEYLVGKGDGLHCTRNTQLHLHRLQECFAKCSFSMHVVLARARKRLSQGQLTGRHAAQHMLISGKERQFPSYSVVLVVQINKDLWVCGWMWLYVCVACVCVCLCVHTCASPYAVVRLRV